MLSGGQPFYNLAFSGSGSWTLNDDTTVGATGSVALTAGTLTQTAYLQAVSVTGPMIVSGGAYSGTSKAFLVNGDLTLSGGTFNAPSTSLIVQGAFNKVAAGTFNRSGDVKIAPATAKVITTSGTTTFNALRSTRGWWEIGRAHI